jgi:hypothetical protein
VAALASPSSRTSNPAHLFGLFFRAKNDTHCRAYGNSLPQAYESKAPAAGATFGSIPPPPAEAEAENAESCGPASRGHEQA